MKISQMLYIVLILIVLPLTANAKTLHVWEMVEITLHAQNEYKNPYTDVDVWVDLKGPDFKKRVQGFWDGGNIFKIRILATNPGRWDWKSGANANDAGLVGHSGEFSASEWTEKEKQENSNRRGTIRSTQTKHALEYADGTPFFLLSDTHWAIATWRYPFKGKEPAQDYQPGSGMGFEEFIQHLKMKGFNSVGFITCFPNWAIDAYKRNLSDRSGTQVRNAWLKPGQEEKAADMHDEAGNRPFFLPGKSNGFQDACADYDRLNPEYWKNLDTKMQYMSDNGFVPYLETIRRDHFPTWIKYYNFQKSFPRFLTYIRARYGAYNFIYALAHMDTVPSGWLKDGKWDAIKSAFEVYYDVQGPMPFGQPTTLMADWSTYNYVGDPEWITLHTTGNRNRNNKIIPIMEELFKLNKPCFNNEPYYTGHNNPRKIAGEAPPINSDRDNYFARANMYCNVLSGGMAGYVYGSLSWPGITTGEPDPWNDLYNRYGTHFWKPFNFPAHGQAKYIQELLFSEGTSYQHIELAADDVVPRRNEAHPEGGMDGSAFMMRTPDKSLAFLYFQLFCHKPNLNNMRPESRYKAQWFNPRTGEYLDIGNGFLESDKNGTIVMPNFPSGKQVTKKDWAVKLKLIAE